LNSASTFDALLSRRLDFSSHCPGNWFAAKENKNHIQPLMKLKPSLAVITSLAFALSACDQASTDAQKTVEKTGDAVEATAEGVKTVAEEANAAVADTAKAAGDAVTTGVQEANSAAVATTEAVQAVAEEANDAAKTAVGEANQAVLETGDAIKDAAQDVQHKVE
jgi:hypothetical protein